MSPSHITSFEHNFVNPVGDGMKLQIIPSPTG